jgi:MoaA/NifB/PqqE/SkfB family radical SAM enzyme
MAWTRGRFIEYLRGRRPWGLRLLVLAVSDRCDQKCAHCQIWIGDGSETRRLTLAERLATVEDALAAGAREALLTGGEPLLSPDLWPIAARLRAAGARVMLATNGMLLAHHAAVVAEAFDELYVSLDGASASTHDGLRGVPAFERLRLGLRALRARPRRPRLVARSTLHARNAHEIEGIVAAARELGFDQVSFLPLDASSDAFGGDPAARAALVPSERRIEALEAGIRGLDAAGLLGRFVAEDATRLRRVARHLRAGAGLQAFERPACDAPWWSSVVDADGRVRPCFFHEPVGDAREGVAALRASATYRAALARIRAPNPTCERCVCPKLRGPEWLGRLRERSRDERAAAMRHAQLLASKEPAAQALLGGQTR